MLAQSDYVVVTTPLTPESRGMIGERGIRSHEAQRGADQYRPRAGGGRSGADPCAASERRIRGAALDVFDTEPLPAGHPFYQLDNVLLSPHCADHTPDWKERTMRVFLENFRAVPQRRAAAQCGKQEARILR